MMLLPLPWWLGEPSMLPLGDISEKGSGFEDGETEGGRVTCRSRRGNVQKSPELTMRARRWCARIWKKMEDCVT